MSQELELEVFRAGDYGPRGKWSEEQLDAMAEDYDPELHEAPVTLDHAQEGPALGWVVSVRRSGDRLMARLKDLNADLIKMLRHGAFKKRSVEIYTHLPESGRPYLKAVSFLGAAAPAVKGLRDLVFGSERPARFNSERGEFVAFEFADGPARETGPAQAEEDAQEREAGADRDAARVAFAELERELRRAGHWLPAWERQGIAEFFEALTSVDEIELSPSMALKPSQWFSEFLRRLPAFLPMGEAAPAGWVGGRAGVPREGNVSAASIELHRRVEQMRTGRPNLSYAEALRECSMR